ncbi:alpha/beta fold hydrolase [Aureimonas populi]|uniref:Alpha/beta hydrolase n=1 Tax=Aureimonas populi TaxID=1701758 RepID=A0ABW5CIF4_9HYPH|nr:alpha/beta hydrolase [Aureimonas populi]
MKYIRLALAYLLLLGTPGVAQVAPFPSGFRTERVATDGAELHVRIGGRGPAVVLLHGYTQTGDMWAPLAAELAREYTVIVPDLRGLGLSSRPPAGYDKRTQAADIAAVLDRLGVQRAAVVGHDIGNMVGYAVAARYPERVTRLVLMDAPVPGLGPWEDVVRNRALWHFSFGGPDAERLVAGRERIYLDRFWNEFAADPAKLTDATRAHYAALYSQPGAMRAGFAQFAAFEQDAVDNKDFASAGKLTMPVLAIGGAKSFGETMAAVMRAGAADVEGAVIPNAGHWLMEEQPAATIAAVRDFLASPR